MRRDVVNQLIVGLLAAVLLIAASLKALALARGEGHLLDVGLVAVECALATWLLWSRRPGRVGFVAVVLFAAFLGYNVRHLIDEAPFSSCGCFGQWEIPLLGVIILDLACLGGAAWLALPRDDAIHAVRSPRVGLCAGLVATALVYAPPAPPVLVRRDVPLGVARPHETRTIAIQVRTARLGPVTLVGARCSAGIQVLRGLPKRIRRDQPVVITFRVHWPATDGPWRRPVQLLTDHGSRVTIMFRGETSEHVWSEVSYETGDP